MHTVFGISSGDPKGTFQNHKCKDLTIVSYVVKGDRWGRFVSSLAFSTIPNGTSNTASAAGAASDGTDGGCRGGADAAAGDAAGAASRRRDVTTPERGGNT